MPTIVVLDGRTTNPGDNPWDPVRAHGDLTVYERTPDDKIVDRAKGAEIVLTNKTPLDAEISDWVATLDDDWLAQPFTFTSLVSPSPRSFRRGDWWVSTVTRTIVASDAECFKVNATVDARSHNAELYDDFFDAFALDFLKFVKDILEIALPHHLADYHFLRFVNRHSFTRL
jgi:hypothetical protein